MSVGTGSRFRQTSKRHWANLSIVAIGTRLFHTMCIRVFVSLCAWVCTCATSYKGSSDICYILALNSTRTCESNWIYDLYENFGRIEDERRTFFILCSHYSVGWYYSDWLKTNIPSIIFGKKNLFITFFLHKHNFNIV